MGRFHPGVYLEEIPSGVQPIEGVSTSTAAFIGKAEMGPMNQAVLVTSQPEFPAKFGTFLNDELSGTLGPPVLQQRRQADVHRAGGGRPGFAASITIKDRKNVPAKTLTDRGIESRGVGQRAGRRDHRRAARSGQRIHHHGVSQPQRPEPAASTADARDHPEPEHGSERGQFRGDRSCQDTSKYITATVDPANQATAAAGDEPRADRFQSATAPTC